MHKIIVLGAGKVGGTIAALLAESGDYQITVADISDDNLAALAELPRVSPLRLDMRDEAALQKSMHGHFAVLSAAPYMFNKSIAQAARRAGVHMLDLTEDVESSNFVRELAATANCAFIPQCGLAPGFISIVASNLMREFDEVRDVRLRVGALPENPTNALKYNLTWSTDGLINEYLNPCEAIVDGKRMMLSPLEGLEEFSLDGLRYEAFNTSGGLGTLCDTYEGSVQNMNYRTVRYPGHCEVLKLLIRDLRLGERPDMLKDIFEHALPSTPQDVVLIFVAVSGMRDTWLTERNYKKKIYAQQVSGITRSAIQLTTAASICAVLDLLIAGKLRTKGFVRQEDILFDDFVANRFGQYYA